MAIKVDLRKKPSLIFSKNLKTIATIQRIEGDLSGNNVDSAANKVSFLNQAYVLYVIAFWQVFIEDSLRYGLHLIAIENQESRIQSILKKRVEIALKKFNTPKKEQIDALFMENLAITDISNCWRGIDGNHISDLEVLSKLLTTRHRIAHGGRPDRKLDTASNFRDMEKLFNLACLLEKALIDNLAPV